MSQRELIEWSHYYKIEPFGPEIEQIRNAQIRADLFNASGNVKQTVKPEDLLPDRFSYTADENQTLDDQMKAWLS